MCLFALHFCFLQQRQKGKGVRRSRTDHSNSSDDSAKAGKRKTAFSHLTVFALVAILGVVLGLFFVFRSPRVSQPLALPPVISMETRQSPDYSSRLWGTYRYYQHAILYRYHHIVLCSFYGYHHIVLCSLYRYHHIVLCSFYRYHHIVFAHFIDTTT